MSRKSWLNYGLAAAVIILIVAAVTAFWYISTLPQHISNHETLVLGQNTFSPGSTAAMRVLVNDSADGKPLADAEVSLSLRPRDNSSPAQAALHRPLGCGWRGECLLHGAGGCGG